MIPRRDPYGSSRKYIPIVLVALLAAGIAWANGVSLPIILAGLPIFILAASLFSTFVWLMLARRRERARRPTAAQPDRRRAA